MEFMLVLSEDPEIDLTGPPADPGRMTQHPFAVRMHRKGMRGGQDQWAPSASWARLAVLIR